MANPEHLEILKQGVEHWNRWRGQNLSVRPDLRGAELDGMNLCGANLRETDLNRVNLAGANLRGASLYRADISRALMSKAILVGANLIEAHLYDVILSRSDLRRSDLTGASLRLCEFQETNLSHSKLKSVDLSGSMLNGADLSGADIDSANLFWASLKNTDFTKAVAGETLFANVDLSVVLALETVVHTKPSNIGIDTIYKSHGEIPEIFLRGCGVPNEFIEFARGMRSRAIEFYSCFISYSTLDQEFAERLYNDLQGNGVRCWFAPHDIKGGRKVHEQIDEAIRLHDRLLLILSEQSMNSEWVKTEIAKARKREVKEAKRVLFPVRLVEFEAMRDWECFDGDTGKDSAREIREYFIPDFSNWKDHDSYQKAFQRLVKDLKAGDRG